MGESMMSTQELVEIDNLKAIDVFVENGLQPVLDELKEEMSA